MDDNWSEDTEGKEKGNRISISGAVPAVILSTSVSNVYLCNVATFVTLAIGGGGASAFEALLPPWLAREKSLCKPLHCEDCGS